MKSTNSNLVGPRIKCKECKAYCRVSAEDEIYTRNLIGEDFPNMSMPTEGGEFRVDDGVKSFKCWTCVDDEYK